MLSIANIKNPLSYFLINLNTKSPFSRRHSATPASIALFCCIIAPQQKLNAETLVRIVRQLLVDGRLQAEIKKNNKAVMPHTATQKVAEVLVHAVIANI